jgi:mRNA-degrading endonuclease RelE of RelBE toxin-antitoxin system
MDYPTKTWTLCLTTNFSKQLKQIDRPCQIRILKFLKDLILESDNPKVFAKSLTGRLAGYWHFHIVDYRSIADIQENSYTIIALDLNHRRHIYN